MYSFELCCKIFEFYETTLSENSAIVKDSKPMQKPIKKKKKANVKNNEDYKHVYTAYNLVGYYIITHLP